MMDNLGELLKKKREERGITLEDIAEKTKISTYFLRKIEENAFHKLPKAYFRRAIIKEYLQHIGFENPDELIKNNLKLIYPEEDKIQSNNDLASNKDTHTKKNYYTTLLLPIIIIVFIGALIYILSTKNLKKPKIRNSKTKETVALKKYSFSKTQIKKENNVTKKENQQQLSLNIKTNSLFFRGDCWLQIKRNGQIIFSRLVKEGEEIKFIEGDTILIGAPENVKITFKGKVFIYNGNPGKPITLIINEDGIRRFFIEKQ